MRNPGKNCDLCPRLLAFRTENQCHFPDKHNAPVPSFGSLNARLLVVGLAPGLRGANFSGRPFTGDYAGELLYASLLKFGFATGVYGARPDDGLALADTRITNAVRCVPPENKPLPAEINTCRDFLTDEIAHMPDLKAVLCLGLVSHNAVIKTMGLRIKNARFAHGAVHIAPSGVLVFDSYHCSRYNTNTGRLTAAMFEDVIGSIRDALDRSLAYSAARA